MTVKDINEIIKIVCPNDEDYEKPIISPKYLRQELEQLTLEQEHRHLEQESTTKNDLAVDCISREGVLKLIYDYKENHSSDREHYPINYGTLLDMIRWVRNLSSVTPQPRKGRWIEERDDYGKIIHWHCSNCYDDSGFTTTCKWDFCPNCGSDNREVEE